MCREPAAVAAALEGAFGLARRDFGATPVFAVGACALALLECGDGKPGVDHVAFAGSAEGTERDFRGLPRAPVDGLDVKSYVTAPLELPRSSGPVERLDHLGVAVADVDACAADWSGRLGFPLESRQTDVEVVTAMESFTSDKYGVVYHSRKPEPVAGVVSAFVTVGDFELEFLGSLSPGQLGEVDHGRSGTTRQDHGAIARFVASRGPGLHHLAFKVADIDAMLARCAAAGLRTIDRVGRPGGRASRIGFIHPSSLGGVLAHFVERREHALTSSA
jgi:catechol 2,3-dioxygenase-like lactoylglutathione lyase family enzyme